MLIVATVLNSAALAYQLEDRTMLNSSKEAVSTIHTVGNCQVLQQRNSKQGKRCGGEILRLKET